jgi:hypothetical protein
MKNTISYLDIQAKQKGMTTYQTNLSHTNLREAIILNHKNIKELLVNDKTNFIHAITDPCFYNYYEVTKFNVFKFFCFD